MAIPMIISFCHIHRHLRNIDCLMAQTTSLFASLVLLMAPAKKIKKKKKTGTSCGHITNLKQSIWETFDIYGRISSPGL